MPTRPVGADFGRTDPFGLARLTLQAYQQVQQEQSARSQIRQNAQANYFKGQQLAAQQSLAIARQGAANRAAALDQQNSILRNVLAVRQDNRAEENAVLSRSISQDAKSRAQAGETRAQANFDRQGRIYDRKEALELPIEQAIAERDAELKFDREKRALSLDSADLQFEQNKRKVEDEQTDRRALADFYNTVRSQEDAEAWIRANPSSFARNQSFFESELQAGGFRPPKRSNLSAALFPGGITRDSGGLAGLGIGSVRLDSDGNISSVTIDPDGPATPIAKLEVRRTELLDQLNEVTKGIDLEFDDVDPVRLEIIDGINRQLKEVQDEINQVNNAGLRQTDPAAAAEKDPRLQGLLKDGNRLGF